MAISEESKSVTKVILLGQTGVGKTALFNRLRSDIFNIFTGPTVGCTFARKVIDGQTLEFWDTAGQERYRCLISHYYRDAKIIILMFDVNNLGTLEELSEYILILITKRQYHPKAKFMIVGNKTDLRHEDTASITAKYRHSVVVHKNGFDIYEPYYISIKENENVDMLLADILDHAREFDQPEMLDTKTELVNLQPVPAAGKESSTGCGC